MSWFELSEDADHDLTEIYVYSYRTFGPDQAANYLTSLDRCFELLAANPGAGRRRLEFDPPIRSHHHRSHLVFYDVHDDRILIVRVLHESMDFKRHLTSEPRRSRVGRE